MNFTIDLFLKLGCSLLIGGIIGAERELRSKSAGFRTIILICLGATLFTIFSEYIGSKSGTPDRIVANVVVGIGFIGAGVIFKGINRVNGITTAATIWLTAALGVGVGCGYYSASLLGCILVFIVLYVFSKFDYYLDKWNQVREFKITYVYEDGKQHHYELLFKKFNLKVINRVQKKSGNIIFGNWTVVGNEKMHHQFIEYMLKTEKISDFEF